MRFPSKANSLKWLREAGVEIGTVLDVGIQYDTPELRTIFQDRKQILFEPVEEYHPHIRNAYAANDYELVPCAASDTDGIARLKTNDLAKDGKVTNSTIAGPQDEAGTFRDVKTVRLDTFMKGRSDPS